MSKYTTELRFICEQYAGLSESVGYPNVKDVIEQSRTKIFDFDFPIFDEEYRAVLETKIIKHYYMYEIGFETVSLFKYFLDTRLNEIMPYYNQLYKSELIKFDPMCDFDYTVQGNRTGSGNKDTLFGSVRKRELETTDTRDLTTEGRRDLTTSDKRTLDSKGSSDKETSEDRTLNTAGQKDWKEDGSGNVTTSNNDSGETHTTESEFFDDHREYSGNGNNDGYDIHKNSSSVDGTDKLTQDETDTKTTKGTTEVNSSGESSNTVNSSTDTNGTKWDYYHDTPQGSIATLNDQTYLTNARKLTEDSTVGYQGTDKGSTSNTENGSSTGNETVTKSNGEDRSKTEKVKEDKEENKHEQWDKSEDEAHNRFTTHTNTTNETKESTGSENTSSTKSGVEHSAGGEEEHTAGTEHVDTTGNEGENKTGSENENTSGSENEEQNGTEQETTNDNSNENQTFNTLDDYAEHHWGKSSNLSYSKMLQEFRETFLNIDMMIINELYDLFMLLW